MKRLFRHPDLLGGSAAAFDRRNCILNPHAAQGRREE
jgi:hypothetical protein